MNHEKDEMEIRPITLEDLKAMFSIDQEIRATGKVITYADITTEDIFTISQEENRHKMPLIYIAELLDFGFVAEISGQICGFVLGRLKHELDTEVGLLTMLGIRPDYQRKGIATKLLNVLSEKYRSKGIKTLCAIVDQQDKDLLGFIENMGFIASYRVDYTKTL
ncbi:GNAT family N-acetyltransferase [Chloroflexota bacterium]